jgi:hypothetical protein
MRLMREHTLETADARYGKLAFEVVLPCSKC